MRSGEHYPAYGDGYEKKGEEGVESVAEAIAYATSAHKSEGHADEECEEAHGLEMGERDHRERSHARLAFVWSMPLMTFRRGRFGLRRGSAAR